MGTKMGAGDRDMARESVGGSDVPMVGEVKHEHVGWGQSKGDG